MPQDFLDKMEAKIAVSEAESPVKASVESVLPGVQQRFNDLQTQINRIEGMMEKEPWVTGKRVGFFIFILNTCFLT